MERLAQRSSRPSDKHVYDVAINVSHPVPTRFTTLAHELAHLFLGHLGEDKGRGVLDRRDRPLAEMECEAEMTAYLVARRSGITPRSESYLADYRGALDRLDLYGVMRAANAAEACMGVATHQLWAAKA